MLYLAIDQHCKQLTVNLRNEQGDVLLKRQVSTEWKRVRAFFEQLQQQSHSDHPVASNAWEELDPQPLS